MLCLYSINWFFEIVLHYNKAIWHEQWFVMTEDFHNSHVGGRRREGGGGVFLEFSSPL